MSKDCRVFDGWRKDGRRAEKSLLFSMRAPERVGPSAHLGRAHRSSRQVVVSLGFAYSKAYRTRAAALSLNWRETHHLIRQRVGGRRQSQIVLADACANESRRAPPTKRRKAPARIYHGCPQAKTPNRFI